jgi:hypothetical protein
MVKRNNVVHPPFPSVSRQKKPKCLVATLFSTVFVCDYFFFMHLQHLNNVFKLDVLPRLASASQTTTIMPHGVSGIKLLPAEEYRKFECLLSYPQRQIIFL